MTNYLPDRMREHRYTRLQEYLSSLSNERLFHLWMSLDGEVSPTFQGIPMTDWEDMVYQELVARGIFKREEPSFLDTVTSWITTFKKERRKKQHKQVLKAIERRRTA